MHHHICNGAARGAVIKMNASGTQCSLYVQPDLRHGCCARRTFTPCQARGGVSTRGVRTRAGTHNEPSQQDSQTGKKFANWKNAIKKLTLILLRKLAGSGARPKRLLTTLVTQTAPRGRRTLRSHITISGISTLLPNDHIW